MHYLNIKILKQLPLAVAISLSSALMGCDDPNNSGQSNQSSYTPNTSSQAQPPTQPEKSLSYGEKGARSDWPAFLDTELPIASDLVVKNYYIVVDGSGSMAGRGCSGNDSKMDVAKQAISTFMSKLPKSANLGVFAFDNAGSSERMPLGQNSLDVAMDVVTKIQAGGGTPLSQGVEAGVSSLTKQGIQQLGYGEYHLVVVTDGQASAGYAPDDEVRQLLDETPIVLHTIGFCIDEKHSLNKPGYTIYRGANDPGSLMAGLDAVLAESPVFDVQRFQGDEQ